MKDRGKKINKMNLLKGAAIGFMMGIIWELMIISPIMSDWSLRSIIVALSVSGLGCSFAGAIFSLCKKEKAETKNTVVA